jgi:hypothetical protein
MHTQVDRGYFHDSFRRFDRKDQFSHEARNLLFDYYEELEESGGEPIELDVVGICCDWCEYASASEACAEYSDGPEKPEEEEFDEEDFEAECLEYLQDRTTVLELGNGGVVVLAF